MPVKQSMLYNDLLIPKDHKRTCQEMATDIWNDINRIDSAYPNDEILVEHILRDLGNGQYSIDMRLSSPNSKVQAYLDTAYERHIYWPRLDKPASLNENDFHEHGDFWNKKRAK